MDIIAAISTGNAATAIGVVRISGDGCFALCDRLFRPLYGGALSTQPPRKMIYGDVLDTSGDVLDRVLAVRFPGPNSYTGEDSAEFHCHGSPVVLRELLDMKLWQIPDRIKDRAAFVENIDQNIQKYNPGYWSAREKRLSQKDKPPQRPKFSTVR